MTRAICIAAMSLLLSACGETAYKMGGSGDEFRLAQKSCHMDSGDEATYSACMKAKGWTMVGYGTDDVAPAVEPQATATTSTMPMTSPPAAAVSDSPQPSKPHPMKAAPVDPNEIVAVGSWWKMGPTNFKADLHACMDKLGDPHRYDETNHTATRGLVACMRTKNWRVY